MDKMMPGPPPLLAWNPRFNTGHPEIDAQHQELVAMLNRFSAGMQAENDTSSIALFASFKDALRRHFEFEDAALRAIGTPQDVLDAQAGHHAESLQLLEDLGQQLARNPHEYSSAVLAGISHCLLVDLLDDDRQAFFVAVPAEQESTSTSVTPVLQTLRRLIEILNHHHVRISEARDFYLTLLQDFPAPLLRADASGQFDWFNRAWFALTGIPAETAADLGWIAALHADDRPAFLDGWRRSAKAQAPFDIEYRLIDAGGTLHWIHHVGHPFFDGDGDLLGYLCTLYDITARRKSEAELRISATVFDHATDAIMITDAAGRIEAINPAFSRLTGYPSALAIGQPPSLLRSGLHDQDFYKSMWQQVVTSGRWEGEIVNRRANGEMFAAWLSITTIREGDGEITRMVSVFNDIASQQASRKRWMHLAHHDALTGLPNRLLFDARAQHSLERCAREGSSLAILFIDLDDFKPVNDRLGHKTGDQVLCKAAAQLRSVLRGEDTVARLGGDEFVVLVERAETMEDAMLVAQKLLDVFPLRAQAGAVALEVSASIGISFYPDHGQTVDELLASADQAMYRMKQQRQAPQLSGGDPSAK
jgi:diguanylate cyclase (GGDEF)-like protein/PAS domain S-box-containing protein/hemerythrin-like metal-binding protein